MTPISPMELKPEVISACRVRNATNVRLVLRDAAWRSCVLSWRHSC